MDTVKIPRLPASNPWKPFVVAMGILVVCFSLPLYQLLRFAFKDELFSYIMLVPFISAYLIYVRRQDAPTNSTSWRGPGVGLALAGAAVLVCRFMLVHSGEKLEVEDDLSLSALSFFFFVLGAAFLFWGKESARTYAFPLAMLVFVVPMPVAVRDGIETFLQYGSAYAAHGMLWLARMPFGRQGLVFALPGVESIEVAPECSGIHSSLILFITSLLAGYLFLNSPLNRAVLSVAVIPLALLRNGFRVFTLAELCVHYGSYILKTPIHTKGGPIFFVLSLAPFFGLLWYLRRREERKSRSKMV